MNRQIPKSIVCALLAALLGACSDSSDNGPAVSIPLDIYAVANSCVSIALPGSQRYLAASGDTFVVSGTGPDSAARFRMRAADLGTYLLLDAQGQYLTSDGENLARQSALASDVQRVDGAIVFADNFQSEGEWDLVAAADGSGKAWLQHRRSGRYLAAAGLAADQTDGNSVTLVPSEGCADFPELSVDAEGELTQFEFEDGDVFGFVETHSHLLTNLAFGGGGVYHGSAFHRLGVEHALPDCDIPHGTEGRKDLLGYAFDNRDLSVQEILVPLSMEETPGFNHATAGFPDFTYWPNAGESATHQTQYYKWIERAHLAGMRLLVQHAMNIGFLCDMFTALGNRASRYGCNDMVSVDHILDQTWAMQDYIDAQAGGPGKGWFRIVRSPAEAREVIRNGKLAVLLGIETAFLFDCFLVPPEGVARCDEATVRARLDEYHAKGVRVLFPNHKFDNAFAPGDGDKKFIDIGNFALTGHWSNFVACPDEVADQPTVFDDGRLSFPGINRPREVYDSTPPELDGVRNFRAEPMDTLIKYLPQLLEGGPQAEDHCQNAGLTPLGELLISEMMVRGMIIEIDHLPRLAYRKAFQMLEAADYPAVGTHGNSNNGRLYGLGGVSKFDFGRCRSASETATMDRDFQRRIGQIREAGGYAAEGFGFDFNGFAGAPGPRMGEDSVCETPQHDPVTYPFTSYAGDVTFYEPTAGNRRIDFNTEGMVHLGLVAELIEEVRRDGVSDAALEPLFRSAEGYLRMWEKAERRGAALAATGSSPQQP
ncbi:MAG: hypothetical protein KDI17_03995 [Halioglobus sp.]|nr:hypothetical protein [Halioglobus sp.]